MVSEYVVTTGR